MASTKADRRRAEPAAEWYAREVLDCLHVCRAIRTEFQRQDLFGCDVLGMTLRGWVGIQVTAAENDRHIRLRRRRLETFPWHAGDVVLVLQWRSEPDPANKRKKKKWFRVHRYHHQQMERTWTVDDEAISIPAHWLASTWANAHKEGTATDGVFCK